MSDADPLKEDFRKFLFVIWQHLKLPQPTKRQYAVARFLQHGPRRKAVLAFRGVGKSWITAALVLWLLYCNPNQNIVVVSASKSRADSFTTFVRRLIEEIDFLQYLRPKESQRDSKIMFDVGPARASQTASVVSIGITGQMTGNRADVLIADDVEVPGNSATQLMREKLSEAVKEFDALLKPNGSVVFLGTPQTEDSLYKQIEARGYTVRIWPAEYPTNAVKNSYGTRLAPDIEKDMDDGVGKVGHTTEPGRFSDQDLAERKLSYGRAGFSLQFMLDTSLSDADKYPLRLSDLLIMPCDRTNAPEKVIWAGIPENVINDLPNVGMTGDKMYRPASIKQVEYFPYQYKVMAIDPSGRGADESGWAVLGVLHSYVYLLDSGSVAGYDKDSLEFLARKAKEWEVNHVIAEANFGDGMYSALLRPVLSRIYPCTVEEVKHSTQKEKRIIDTLEPVIAGHRLVVNDKVIERDYRSTETLPPEKQNRYRLFYQLTRITAERGSLLNDDRLDALAIGVAHLQSMIGTDVDSAVQATRDRENDIEALKWLEDHCLSVSEGLESVKMNQRSMLGLV